MGKIYFEGLFSGVYLKFFFILVPDMVEDETAGCLHFAEEFTNRYGALHPEFFPGTLEDAIKEACMKPAREVSTKLAKI